MMKPLSARPGSRKKLWIILAASLLALSAGLVFLVGSRGPKSAPVAYVFPQGEAVTGKIGWRRVTIDRPIAVLAQQKLHLAEGAEVRVYSTAGQLETLRGPLERVFAPPLAIEGNEHWTTPLSQLLGAIPDFPEDPDGMGITITSPVGVTRFRIPMIDWRSKDGVLYDVAIVDPDDPAAPPRRLRGVRPPLPASQLETTMRPELPVDRIFGVLVRESANQNVIGANRFLTSPDAVNAALPQKPADLLAEAIEGMARTPFRIGDSHTALTLLPPAWKNSELAVRLRWKIAFELRDKEELKALAARTPPAAKP